MFDIITPHHKKKAVAVTNVDKVAVENAKISLALDSGKYDIKRGGKNKEEVLMVAHSDVSYTPQRVLIFRAKISNFVFNSKILINPIIVEKSGEQVVIQSDLTKPEKSQKKIKRYKDITVEFLNTRGVQRRGRCSGIVAGLIQQGIERLDGISILDPNYEENREVPTSVEVNP